MYPVYWLIAVAVFLAIEIVTLGLTSIWFAGGALIAAIGAGLGLPLYGQLILWLVVSCVLFAITRPIAKNHLNNKTQKTNAESLIGEVALVTERIDNIKEQGTVHIHGLDWKAKTMEEDIVIEEDKEVVIEAIRGVTLIVRER